MKIKIIESDHDRCLTLSELLPEALIIHGDGSDDTLLYSENLHEMGAFVSLTGHDEENFMLALLAKQAGVPKVIAKISRNNYLNLIKNLGIDSVVNPGQTTTNLILMFVRGLKNALGNPIKSLYRIVNNQAEALEFTICETTDFLGIPLKYLKIPQNVLVAVIVRKNEIIIPHGDDSIKLGDSIILIAKNRQVFNLNDIISVEGKLFEYQNGFESLGIVILIEGLCMVLPLLVSLIYGQGDAISFVISILISVTAGSLLYRIPIRNSNFYARDGFAVVALSWIVISFLVQFLYNQ